MGAMIPVIIVNFLIIMLPAPVLGIMTLWKSRRNEMAFRKAKAAHLVVDFPRKPDVIAA